MSTLLRHGRALDRNAEIIDLEETVCVPRYDCSKARQLGGGGQLENCGGAYTDCANEAVKISKK